MFGNEAHNNNDNMDDLNSSLEDVEIDEPGEKEETLKERSNCWDNKVKLKRKKIIDDVIIEEKKKKVLESKKKSEEEKSLKKVKKENKQRKQKVKDLNKKKNKRAKSEAKESQPRNAIPNIKPIPLNCTHLVHEDDVLYTVPGDGACGPSSACAFYLMMKHLALS